MKKKIAVYKEGLVLRRQNIEQAKLSLAKEEAELEKLKNEEKILKGLVQQLKGNVALSFFPLFLSHPVLIVDAIFMLF